MQKVLLTGAGQVGAQMIRLLHEEYGVTPVVLDLQFNWELLDSVVDRDWFVAVQGSILDHALVRETLRSHQIEHISHSAAVLPMRVGHDPHPGFFEVNVNGTASLIFVALEAGVRRFVMFSTNGVYQFREHGVSAPVDEDYPTGLSLHNSYGNSKATAEFLLKELTLAGRIEGRILRPGEIYGPVISRPGDDEIYWKSMFDAAITGEPFLLEGHPEHRLDWVHCKDVARAACKVLISDKVPSLAYNVTYGRCVGIYDIKVELDRLFPGNRVELRDCGHGGWNHPLSNRRLAEELDIVPEFDLAAGISDYAEWLVGARRTMAG